MIKWVADKDWTLEAKNLDLQGLNKDRKALSAPFLETDMACRKNSWIHIEAL